MSYWDNREQFLSRFPGEFGLVNWFERVNNLFNHPMGTFIACGTWSDPSLASLTIVNSGVTRTLPYDPYFYNYSLCAWSVALWHSIGRDDWDMLIALDTDCLIGAIDLNSLFTDFEAHDEEVMSGAWSGFIGGPMIVFKRSGVIRWLNGRLRANLIEPHAGPKPLLPEEEMTLIFKDRWYNPWTDFPELRQDWPENKEADSVNEEVMKWPMVRKPHPAVINAYKRECSSKTIPVLRYR